MHDMNDIKKMLREFADRDASQTPSAVFKGLMRAALVDRDFDLWDVKMAEAIVARMDVQLGLAPLDIEDLREMANSYARIVDRLADAYRAQGFANPRQAVLESASQLSLKLS